MLKGRYITLLTIFSLISLVGTGFSSWVVTGVSYSTLTGTITVAETSDIKSMIDFNNSGDHPNGYTCFSYCSEGFVENSAFVSTGTLTYYFDFNKTEAIKRGYMTSSTKFETILSLAGNTNENFYKTLERATLNLSGATTKSTNTNYDNNGDGINESILSTIEILNFEPSSSAEVLSLKLSYIFDSTLFDLGVNFDENNPPSFNFQLRMTKG